MNFYVCMICKAIYSAAYSIILQEVLEEQCILCVLCTSFETETAQDEGDVAYVYSSSAFVISQNVQWIQWHFVIDVSAKLCCI
jgi:hypothetical protein